MKKMSDLNSSLSDWSYVEVLVAPQIKNQALSV